MEKTLTLPYGAYRCLMDHIPRGTEAHVALLKAGNPASFADKTAPRILECDLDTAGVLLQVAVEHCPDAVESIKKCIGEFHPKV